MRRMTADSYTVDDGLAHVIGQLEYIEAKIYEKKYRDIRYADLVPVSNEAGPFAESISYFSMDQVAKAQFIASMANDIPLVDVTENKTTIPVEGAALGYEYSLHEMRVSQFLGKPLDVRRGQAVRRGIEEFAQRVCFLGDSAHGLPGFLNNAAVEALTAGGVWSGRTPVQILADVNTLLTGRWATTNTVELMDTLLLPPTQYGDIATRHTGTELHYTVMELIMKDNIYTKRTGNALTIEPLSELVDIGAGVTDRMMAYRRDPEVVEFHFPMPLMFHPPQATALRVMVPGEFRVSGTEIRYPGACGYSDGI